MTDVFYARWKVAVPSPKDNMRRVFFYFGLLFLVLIVGASKSVAECLPPQPLQNELKAHPSAEAYSHLGIWYSNHKQYSCAIETFRAGLKRDPQSADLYYLVGLNLLRKGDFEEAVEPLQKSIELNPELPKPHLLLATTLEQLNRLMDARKEWLTAVKIDPHSEMALDGASKNLLATSNYAEVMQLLGSEPQGETLTVDLAAAYEGYGDKDQAGQLLEKAFQANPSSSALTRSLIMFLISQERYVRAAELSKQLIQQNPKDIDAQVLYLHVMMMNGEESTARPLAKKLLLTAPHNFDVLYLNGTLDNLSGNYTAARTHFEEAIKLNGNDPSCRFYLGTALSQLHDLKGAREQFEKALSLGATDNQVRFEYAKVLRALGETELAAEQLQLYQNEQKKNTDRAAGNIKTAQADKELSGSDPQKAVGLYREAIALSPDNAMLNFKLSIALDRVGDRAGEMDALKKAIQLDPQMAVAHYQLAYLASLSGDFALAEKEYGSAVNAAPAYLQAWVGLAATLGTENRLSEAKQAVANALKIDPKDANAIELQKELTNAAPQAN